LLLLGGVYGAVLDSFEKGINFFLGQQFLHSPPIE
jgi:hypothetical protein